eukprot:2676226-Rhodomonas_salina.3
MAVLYGGSTQERMAIQASTATILCSTELRVVLSYSVWHYRICGTKLASGTTAVAQYKRHGRGTNCAKRELIRACAFCTMISSQRSSASTICAMSVPRRGIGTCGTGCTPPYA